MNIRAYVIVSAFAFHQLSFAPTFFMESDRDVFQTGVIHYHPTFRPEDHPSVMPRLLFQYTTTLNVFRPFPSKPAEHTMPL
jgi:hypothetical protein